MANSKFETFKLVVVLGFTFFFLPLLTPVGAQTSTPTPTATITPTPTLDPAFTASLSATPTSATTSGETKGEVPVTAEVTPTLVLGFGAALFVLLGLLALVF